DKAAAENQLNGTLKTLFAVAEAYPELKANTNFLDLQAKLADLEDQIQMARRYYNGTVRDYNIMCETFPSVFVASMFGFKKAEFFELAGAEEREAPKVSFDNK
ncbi:LemA family protein, partial [Candidatus Cryosericum hinesii]